MSEDFEEERNIEDIIEEDNRTKQRIEFLIEIKRIIDSEQCIKKYINNQLIIARNNKANLDTWIENNCRSWHRNYF